MMTLKENQIISVDDYLNYLDKYNFYKEEGKLFFRGQLSKFKDMRPSIARNENVFSRESKIYENIVKSIIIQKMTLYEPLLKCSIITKRRGY